MKAKIIKKEEKKFEPVIVELTFETREELMAMYAVSNRAANDIWKIASNGISRYDLTDDTSHWISVKDKLYDVCVEALEDNK